MKAVCILLFTFLFMGCNNKPDSLTAQQIIEKAIDTSCNKHCDEAVISFTFRDKKYKSERTNGNFQLERMWVDSTGPIRDVLTNTGFTRYIANDSVQVLADSTAAAYANSVNSVHYFAQLPYGLKSEAVLKKLLGETTIKKQPYYKIEVRFKEEGGGTDFEDVFIYWVHTKNFTVDYLAYEYSVNEGGLRFREAYNLRIIKGIRFVDYNNYKPKTPDIKLTALDSLFEADQLALLSKIETEDIEVTLPQ